jgi:hypothetical protein
MNRAKAQDEELEVGSAAMIDSADNILVVGTTASSDLPPLEGLEVVSAAVIDSADNILVVGWTESSDFPTLKAYDTTHNGNYDAFVCQFLSTGTLQWSTFLGGGNVDEDGIIELVALMVLVVLGSGAVGVFIYCYYKRERVLQ